MKSFSAIAVIAFLLLGTVSYANDDAKKAESGKFTVNRDTRGYNLHDNEGPRSFTLEVRFREAFASKPEIILSVTSVDSNNKANLRYRIESSFVSPEGFILKFSTWEDTKIYSMEGQWMAIDPN